MGVPISPCNYVKPNWYILELLKSSYKDNIILLTVILLILKVLEYHLKIHGIWLFVRVIYTHTALSEKAVRRKH